MFIQCTRGKDKGWKWCDNGVEHYGINAREAAMLDARADLDEVTGSTAEPLEKLRLAHRSKVSKEKLKAEKAIR